MSDSVITELIVVFSIVIIATFFINYVVCFLKVQRRLFENENENENENESPIEYLPKYTEREEILPDYTYN